MPTGVSNIGKTLEKIYISSVSISEAFNLFHYTTLGDDLYYYLEYALRKRR